MGFDFSNFELQVSRCTDWWGMTWYFSFPPNMLLDAQRNIHTRLPSQNTWKRSKHILSGLISGIQIWILPLWFFFYCIFTSNFANFRFVDPVKSSLNIKTIRSINEISIYILPALTLITNYLRVTSSQCS